MPEKTIFQFDWTDDTGRPITHGVSLASIALARQYARGLQGGKDKAGDIEVYRDDGNEMEYVFSVPKGGKK